MRETLALHAGFVWAAVALIVLLLAGAIALRRMRGRRQAVPAPAPKLDIAQLTLAVQDAEKSGARDKLPGLYLSLAQCRFAAGEASDAEGLLRKCIRGAADVRHKDVHARARVVLGDIARINGDLTTACEHWQIARALFFELKQGSDHRAVETRMLKNGCPTDWVLTDF